MTLPVFCFLFFICIFICEFYFPGDLKKEKTELLAHARKQQVRITFLEENLKVSTEQVNKHIMFT